MIELAELARMGVMFGLAAFIWLIALLVLVFAWIVVSEHLRDIDNGG